MLGARALQRLSSLILALILSFVSIPRAFAWDLPDTGQPVKAGVFAFDGYHMLDEDGTMSGYGIDVLDLISRYSHLDFELIGYDRSWNDMLDMLASGEIDVVTSAARTPDREELFAYSLPIGVKSTVLSVSIDDERYRSNDPATYDGMVVGEIAGNSQNDIFADFAADAGFSYSVVSFEDASALSDALATGEVDAILTSDLRRAENERIIDTLAQDDYYAIVRKDDAALLDEINYAIAQMDIQEGDWKNALHYEFYGTHYPSRYELTERERSYIASLVDSDRSVSVMAFADRKPYSYVEDGELKGVMIDYFAALADSVGLPYRVHVVNSKLDYISAIEDGTVDVVLDAVAINEDTAPLFDGGFSTKPYLLTDIVGVVRSGFIDDVRSVVVSDSSSSVLEDYVASLPDVDILPAPDRQTALQEVLDGEADCTYVYANTAQEFMERHAHDALTYLPAYGLAAEFSMWVPKDVDHELVTILDKAIASENASTISSLLTAYTSVNASEMGLVEYLQANPLILAVLMLAVALIVGIIIYLVQRSRFHARLVEQEAIALKAAESANAAKTSFLNSISHDVRTPMNAILGFAVMAKDAGDPASKNEYLGKIEVASDHLLNLINDVLDMSRIESGRIDIDVRPICMADGSGGKPRGLVAEISDVLRAEAESHGLELTVDVSGCDNGYVLGDKLRIMQVLMNIVSNAIKYTPSGSVTLDVASEPIDDGHVMIELTVSDTGIGMSEEFLEHVFEPFARDSIEKVGGIQGTGLGLAIVKKTVDLMDGDIFVESTEGEGSVFTVRIPCEICDPSEVAFEKEDISLDDAKASFDGKHALVVDDDEVNVEIACAILERVGFTCDSAVNGEEAVSIIEDAGSGTYDLILTDMQMPVMDGCGLTSAVRAMPEDKARIPIVMLSGSVFDEDKQRAASAGADGYVNKPIVTDDLFGVLRSVM